MPDPTTLEEYNARSAANHRYEGFGVETTQVFPCPFCGAPDWAKAGILTLEQDLATPHVCTECGRGARMVTTHNGPMVNMEMVQTVGEDPPSYLPRMERES